jgi:uncharacterized protein YecE (DUF72 family)
LQLTANRAEILLGTQGWAYPDWVGPFYSVGTPPNRFLRTYAQHFLTVEVDSTFYGPPRETIIAKWCESTPDGFQFAVKMPRVVSHDKGLFDVQSEFTDFLDSMAAFGRKLGPILIQLPPSFDASHQDEMISFVHSLPTGFRFAIEVRHESWLDQPWFEEALEQKGIARVSSDLFGMPQRLLLTSDFVYVRWLGRHAAIERFDRVQVDRTREYDHWADILDEATRRVSQIYGYVNNHFAGHSPAGVRELQRRLGVSVSPKVQERLL